MNRNLLQNVMGQCALFRSFLTTMLAAGMLTAAAQDTDYWFVAPHLDDHNTGGLPLKFDRPVFFVITAGDQPATVTMEMPALTGFKNRVVKLSARESSLIVFGNGVTAFDNAQMDTIQNNIRNTAYVGVKYNRGIHFYATAPVTIYYQVNSQDSKDMFSLKGSKATGLEFYTPFQNQFFTSTSYTYAYAQFHVVATENNTTVQITPTTSIAGTLAGATKTVTLNRGETFAARNSSQTSGRLSGSHIVADKPVAVTVADDIVNGDLIGDQIVPVNNIGTTYVVVKGLGGTDYVSVLAVTDNTKVYLNGSTTASATLNKGQSYYFSLTANTAVVTANNPVYVFQMGCMVEHGAALLPSMYSINSTGVTLYNDGISNIGFFALVRDGNEGYFTVNGNTSILTASDFTAVPNMPGWKYTRKSFVGTASSTIPDGTVNIRNSRGAFSMGYFYYPKVGTSTSFGYLSGYGTLAFPDTTWMCNGSVTLDGGYAKTYTWTLPNGSTASTATITAADTGLYKVTVNQDPFIINAQTRVLNRFEDAKIVVSPYPDMNAGTYTYTANHGLYSNKHLSYKWFINDVQVSTAISCTATWNATDEKRIKVEITDTVSKCTKTVSVAHGKNPDNVINANCYSAMPSTPWTIKRLAQSSAYVNHYLIPMVGDIDNDGKVEIIAGKNSDSDGSDHNTNMLTIFEMVNGTLAVKQDLALGAYINNVASNMGIANVDGGKYAAIFVATASAGTAFPSATMQADNLQRKLVKYIYNGTRYEPQIPVVNCPRYSTVSERDAAQPMFADFNGDGIPEVIVLDKVYNARTLELLADGGILNNTFPTSNYQYGLGYGGHMNNNRSGNITHKTSHMAIADMDGDGIPEIVAGHCVYKVNITNPNGTTGNTFTLWSKCSGLGPNGESHPEVRDGATIVADIDGDGYPDVIVTSSANGANNSGVYVWNPRTKRVMHTTSLNNLPSWINGTTCYGPSRALAGDVDGDGQSEIVFLTSPTSSTGRLYCYKFDRATKTLINKWNFDNSDNSASTTLTVFDFNSDGKAELVYRDTNTLYIINGETGQVLPGSSFPGLANKTANEYPIIADINNDGCAEIITTGEGRLHVFSSDPAGNWVPARKVWNQVPYNAVNVNEDLTVPRVQLNPATVFPGADGIYGTSDDVQPYNNFLQQQTSLNKNGNPLWLTPDVVPEVAISDCSVFGDSVSVTVGIVNRGDAAIGSPVYVTLYRDAVSSTSKIVTGFANTVIHARDTGYVTLTIPDITLFLPMVNIIVRVNDDGSATFPHQAECDSNNDEITLLNPAIHLMMKKRSTLYGVQDNGKYSNPVSVLFGDSILYEITVVNANTKTGRITVTDTLPPYLNLVIGSCSNAGITTVGTPPLTVITWNISGIGSLDSTKVSYKATPKVGASASQPMFINKAWVRVSDTIFVPTNETWHQGAGVIMVTFSVSNGGRLFNAEEQAIDYKTSPRAGVLVLPDSGYTFAGWKHDEYLSLRGEPVNAVSGVMNYEDIVVYGNVRLEADFVPKKEVLPDDDITLNNKIITNNATGRVWSNGKILHVCTKKGVKVCIYTIEGMLQQQFTNTSDTTVSLELEYGVYIVTLDNGAGYKVVIDN